MNGHSIDVLKFRFNGNPTCYLRRDSAMGGQERKTAISIYLPSPETGQLLSQSKISWEVRAEKLSQNGLLSARKRPEIDFSIKGHSTYPH